MLTKALLVTAINFVLVFIGLSIIGFGVGLLMLFTGQNLGPALGTIILSAILARGLIQALIVLSEKHEETENES